MKGEHFSPMDTSFFLAKLIGPIFLIIGIGLLLNRDRYRAVVEEVMASHTLLYAFGALAITGGIAYLPIMCGSGTGR